VFRYRNYCVVKAYDPVIINIYLQFAEQLDTGYIFAAVIFEFRGVEHDPVVTKTHYELCIGDRKEKIGASAFAVVCVFGDI
jgi:hypothetical protein